MGTDFIVGLLSYVPSLLPIPLFRRTLTLDQIKQNPVTAKGNDGHSLELDGDEEYLPSPCVADTRLRFTHRHPIASKIDQTLHRVNSFAMTKIRRKPFISLRPDLRRSTPTLIPSILILPLTLLSVLFRAKTCHPIRKFSWIFFTVINRPRQTN